MTIKISTYLFIQSIDGLLGIDLPKGEAADNSGDPSANL